MTRTSNRLSAAIPTAMPIDHTELDHLGARIAGLDNSGRARRVLVTGPGRGTGASTLSWALAQRAVLEGQKVLFLDLDPLMPYTQHVLALDPAEELQLAGNLICRPWQLPGRTLEIACINGTVPANRNRTDIGQQLAAELDQLSASYDLIIADGAPVASRRSTGALDGCAVAGLFDMTFLVLLAGVTRATQLEAAVGRVQELGGRIGGLVLNERAVERPLEGLLRRGRQLAARWPWTLRLLGLRPGTVS